MESFQPWATSEGCKKNKDLTRFASLETMRKPVSYDIRSLKTAS